MADDDQSILDATGHTIVLAFDLAESQIANMPTELGKSLNSDEVQDAIRTTLAQFSLAKQKSGTTDVSDQEAKQLANALLTKAGPKISADLLKQLQQTPEFKKLQKSLDDLGQALKSSPLGVWVDKNAGIVYVVGAGLAIGGAVALYVTKTGGPVLNFPLSQLTGKPVKIFKVGKFTLSGQLLSFKPDAREVGGGLVGTQKWDKLEVSLQLGVVATGSDVKEINGKLIFKTNDIDLGITGSGQPSKNTVNLGLTLGVKNIGLPGPLTIGLGAVIKDDKVTQGTLDASMKWKDNSIGVQGSTGSGETKGMVLFSHSF